MIVFIDESGDHNLDIVKLDNQYNVFVLGAVCFEEESYKAFDRNFLDLKRKFFAVEDFIIHTAEITRTRKARSEHIIKFKSPEFRHSFYSEVNELILQTEFKVIACVVRKVELLDKYGEHAQDPYLFSFENVLNRVLFEAEKTDLIKIYPEKRGHPEDVKLNLAWLRTQALGTKFFRGVEVSNRVSDFRLCSKKENLSGLQLSDLIVSPIGRHIIGKEYRPGNEVSYSSIKSKIPSKCLTVFP